MKSFKTLVNRQARYIVSTALLLLGVAAPALTSVAAAADQLTTRSVALSSSAKTATGVSYDFTFTPTDTTAGAILVQFCSNTPLIGQTCDDPAGFDASGATASGGATISGTPTTNLVVVTKTLTTGANSFTLGNITNPDAAGPIYARILTYGAATDTTTYVSDGTGTVIGSPTDQGSVAISITDNVNVSAAVLETMTFCVSGATIPADCDAADVNGAGAALTAPTLKLGKDTGGVIALDSLDVYSGTINTQLSTNAVGGAVVSLKSNTACGGLHRAGAATNVCDIAPALQTGITAGQAKFGLELGPDVTDATNGDIEAVSGSGYSNTAYAFNYKSDNTSGVTSTYGDPILDTHAAPANNRNMPITFGASAANNTPAGLYSTDLSLIATGTF